MPLTPIRVRGKRRPRDTTTNPKKRTREEDAQDRASRSPKIRQLRPPKKSLLERELPLEIIELIFTYSENVNFPRSSPLLGRLLSGRQTLVDTVVAAFGPTWNSTFGNAECVPHRLSNDTLEVPDGFPLDAVPGNPDFQSSIIACRWATVEVILEAQQKWARRAAKALKLDEEAFNAQAWFGRDFSNIARETRTVDCENYIDVHPRVRIPDALIKGPWDEDMARRLVWLRRGGAYLDESQTWELRLAGLQNAFPRHGPPPAFLWQLIKWHILRPDFWRGTHMSTGKFPVQTNALLSSWPVGVLRSVLVDVVDALDRWREAKLLPVHTEQRIVDLVRVTRGDIRGLEHDFDSRK